MLSPFSEKKSALMLEVGVSLPDYMVSHPTRQQYPTHLDI